MTIPDNSIDIKRFIQQTEELVQNSPPVSRTVGLLKVMTASDCMAESRKDPIPKTFCGGLAYPSEVAIFFGDTNTGKSMTIVQMCVAISTGMSFLGLKNEAEPQKVLLLDLELSDKQFELRYSINGDNPFVFHPNFLRAGISRDALLMDGGEDFESKLFESIEQTITTHGIQVLVVDNITWLKQGTEKAKDAAPLMHKLLKLKSLYGLTLIVLAHTPKRDASRPITGNDLQGSSTLLNLADSAFAISNSIIDKSIRYIKQIKQRSCENLYGADNVIVCKVEKQDNFLGLHYLECDKEINHLRFKSEEIREDLEAQVKLILSQDPLAKKADIARKLCPADVSFKSFEVKIGRTIKKLNSVR